MHNKKESLSLNSGVDHRQVPHAFDRPEAKHGRALPGDNNGGSLSVSKPLWVPSSLRNTDQPSKNLLQRVLAKVKKD